MKKSRGGGRNKLPTEAYLLYRVPLIGVRNAPCLIAQRQIAQLVALMKDAVADANVDDIRQHDTRPDW